MLKNAGKKSKREIAEKDVQDIFGLQCNKIQL
jgi:hypothetical protein